MTPRWGRALLVLVSAVLYAIAFPPFELSFVAWFALVPLFIAIRGQRLMTGFTVGLFWGTVMILAIGHWVPVAIAVYWEQPLWFGVAFSIGAAVAFVGLYGGGFGACAGWVSSRAHGLPRVLSVAVLWVTWEVARARVLTGDPWLLAGYALAPHPLWIQIADFGGVYAVSFVVALVNAAVAECIGGERETSWRPAALSVGAAALVIAGVLSYALYRLSDPLPGEPAIPIVVVQGNNNLGSQWKSEHHGRGLEEYLRLSAAAATRSQPRVIVWPESAVTFFLAREPQFRDRIIALLTETGADMIVGSPHFEDDDPARPHYYNSAFYVTAREGITQRYDKAHLMPFGEYFPLRTIELLRRRFERVRYFTPGDGKTLLDTRLGKTAVVICFEAMFPELVRGLTRRGAEVLVNLSNDAWLGDNAGPRQHAAMVTLRAVENRTWVIRATTTGISSVIDPYGRVRSQTPLLQPAVLETAIVPLRIETPYERFGDVFAHACISLSLVTMLALLRRGPEP